MPRPDAYHARLAAVGRCIERLFADFGATVDAAVADGWPEPMVRAGFGLHRRTWDVDALGRAFEAEMDPWGGVDALVGAVDDPGGRRIHIRAPACIAHIWPALPGAGVTPVFFGALLGAPQRIRPSSRGRHFADHLVDKWPDDAAPVDIVESAAGWQSAPVVVVSGTDETLGEIRRQAPEASVTGYGHRVSFAVCVDHDDLDLAQIAAAVATDAVMWGQRGCFSARAVIFCGSSDRMEAFGESLGSAIAAAESRLGVVGLDRAEAAQRAQARGVAEFGGRVFGEGLGWAQPVDEPFVGQPRSAHVVTLHRVGSPDQLADAVDVVADGLQGAALHAPSAVRRRWAEALADIGVTRVCQPGLLQAPPASWRHDGRPNVVDWLQITTID